MQALARIDNDVMKERNTCKDNTARNSNPSDVNI